MASVVMAFKSHGLCTYLKSLQHETVLKGIKLCTETNVSEFKPVFNIDPCSFPGAKLIKKQTDSVESNAEYRQKDFNLSTQLVHRPIESHNLDHIPRYPVNPVYHNP